MRKPGAGTRKGELEGDWAWGRGLHSSMKAYWLTRETGTGRRNGELNGDLSWGRGRGLNMS